MGGDFAELGESERCFRKEKMEAGKTHVNDYVHKSCSCVAMFVSHVSSSSLPIQPRIGLA